MAQEKQKDLQGLRVELKQAEGEQQSARAAAEEHAKEERQLQVGDRPQCTIATWAASSMMSQERARSQRLGPMDVVLL